MADIYAGLGLKTRDEQLQFLEKLMQEGELSKLPVVPFDSFTPTAKRRNEAMETDPGPFKTFNYKTGKWARSQWKQYRDDARRKARWMARMEEMGYEVRD